MGEIVPRDQLVDQAMRGIGGVGGGGVLLILNKVAHVSAGFSLAGLIVGGGLALIGLRMATRDPKERGAGLFTAGAGALTAVASLPIVGGLAGGLMWISGVGLVVAGGISLYRFYKGLRARR